LELALRIEVGYEEASLLVCLRDLGHQLDVEGGGKVLNILLEIQDWRVHLHLVLPVVVSPLLLELELRAISRHECVDEVDLNLVDIDNVRDVATRRVKRQVAVNGSIVCRAHFHATLDDLGCASTKSNRDRFFDNLEVTLGQQLAVNVLNCLLGAVDKDDFEQDIVVVDFSDGFRIDGIRVAGQLVDLLLVLILQLAHEVRSFDST